jgi:hypothetical protein
LSHGQSQEVMATTLLHKAMEYETTYQRRNSRRRYTFICDVYLESYKHNISLPPFKLGIWIKIPRHKHIKLKSIIYTLQTNHNKIIKLTEKDVN